MAYDEGLAVRFRDALNDRANIVEKRMMGGLCFLHNGNMIGGADKDKQGTGRFMFRVGKDNESKALSRPGASIVKMGSRRMGGMIFVDEEVCSEQALSDWISLALSFVTTLPPK